MAPNAAAGVIADLRAESDDLDRLVADLAAADAHLWLWVTNATLRAGYDVAEAWGFTVRSPLTWVKFRLGLGNYLRNSTEHVLFATRGKALTGYRLF